MADATREMLDTLLLYITEHLRSLSDCPKKILPHRATLEGFPQDLSELLENITFSLYHVSYFSEYPLCMSCRFHISPFFQYLACRVEEKCRSYDADIDFAIILLLSDHSILIMELPIFVWDECDTERVFIAELRMRDLTILRYSDDMDSERSELVLQSREVLSFECAAWSIVLWVEVEESFFWVREESREMSHKY